MLEATPCALGLAWRVLFRPAPGCWIAFEPRRVLERPRPQLQQASTSDFNFVAYLCCVEIKHAVCGEATAGPHGLDIPTPPCWGSERVRGPPNPPTSPTRNRASVCGCSTSACDAASATASTTPPSCCVAAGTPVSPGPGRVCDQGSAVHRASACCGIPTTSYTRSHSHHAAVCASCIRGSLDFQEKAGQPACPGCRHPCDARDLLPCHSLREAADRYRRARGAILDLLRPVPPPRASSAELEGAPAPPPAAAPGPPPPAPQRMRTRSSSKSSEAEAGPGSRGSDGTASPSASSSSSGSEWDVDPAAASEADSSPAKGGRSGGQVPCKRQRTGAGGGSDEVGCVTGSDPEHSRNPGLGGPSPPESDPPKVRGRGRHGSGARQGAGVLFVGHRLEERES